MREWVRSYRSRYCAYFGGAMPRPENPGVGGSIPSLPTTFFAPLFHATTSPCEPATMRVPSANTSDGGGRGHTTGRDQPDHVGSALASATVRRLALLRDHELARRGSGHPGRRASGAVILMAGRRWRPVQEHVGVPARVQVGSSLAEVRLPEPSNVVGEVGRRRGHSGHVNAHAAA